MRKGGEVECAVTGRFSCTEQPRQESPIYPELSSGSISPLGGGIQVRYKGDVAVPWERDTGGIYGKGYR